MRYIVIALALAACSKKDPTPWKAETGSAPAPAPVVVPDAAPAGPPAPAYTPADDVPAPIKDAIAAPDRTIDDRRLDAGRKPGEVLAFFKIAPGQRVGELIAGGGYTTELLVRTVGNGKVVWAQNTKDILDRFARVPWTARAARPIMRDVVAVERPLEDPFPAEATNLDAVITVLNYHDTVNWKVDREKMNKAVFAALKSGGVYGIVDSSAAKGSGTSATETLHRIDEEVVKKEVLAAGFTLDASSDVLRNPADTRDWNSSPKAAGDKRGTSDRFVLRFIKK